MSIFIYRNAIELFQNEIKIMAKKHEEALTEKVKQYENLFKQMEQEKCQQNRLNQLLKEIQAKYEHSEREIHLINEECNRLKIDLQQALIKPLIQPTNNKEYSLLIEQCNKLANENIRLKNSIKVMSTQLLAYSTEHPQTISTCLNDNKDKICDKLTNDRLNQALRQIKQLALEKRSLIELSNCLNAQLKHKNGQNFKNDENQNIDSQIENNSIEKHCKTYVLSDEDRFSITTGKESVLSVFKLLDEPTYLSSEPETGRKFYK